MPKTSNVEHKLYFELVGDPSAQKTVLFLHGGPGSGFNNNNKNLFKGTDCRVLFYD